MLVFNCGASDFRLRYASRSLAYTPQKPWLAGWVGVSFYYCRKVTCIRISPLAAPSVFVTALGYIGSRSILNMRSSCDNARIPVLLVYLIVSKMWQMYKKRHPRHSPASGRQDNSKLNDDLLLLPVNRKLYITLASWLVGV